jgi:hypothetical protein
MAQKLTKNAMDLCLIREASNTNWIVFICDSVVALNLILCYYALGDREKMKKTFQKMLQIELSADDDEKYATNGVRLFMNTE